MSLVLLHPPAGSVLVVTVQTNSGYAGTAKSIAVADNLALTYNLARPAGRTNTEIYAHRYRAAAQWVRSGRPHAGRFVG